MKINSIFFRFILFFIIMNSMFANPDYQGDSIDSENWDIVTPEPNMYSRKIEKYLLKKGYLQLTYEEFSSSVLYKKAYLEVYNEIYDGIMPSKVSYYKMADGILYCMLADGNHDDNPPILTFLILEKKGNKKVFYKINHDLQYELVEKLYYDPYQNWELKTRMVKVFY